MLKWILLSALVTLACLNSGAQAVKPGSVGVRFYSKINTNMSKDLLHQLTSPTSRSTSEVITLNLSSLAVLLVIKALMLGVGLVGSSSRSKPVSADGRRSSSDVQSKTAGDDDLMLMLAYILGSNTDDYNCLYRIACQDPYAAHQFSAASKMLLKGAKVFQNSGFYKAYHSDYEQILYALQESILLGKSQSNAEERRQRCSAKYTCSAFFQ